MRVLHYISVFSMQSETFIYDLINNLEEYKHDNYILTHLRVLETERPFSKIKIISENINILRKIYFKFFKKKWCIKNEKLIVKFLRELRPDIIHAHFGPNGIRIYKLIKKYNLKIPLVVSFHGMDINVLPRKEKNYSNILLKMASEEFICFTSPSDFLKSRMVKLNIPGNKINVIHNACNESFVNLKKDRYWNFGDRLKILNIGRFEEVKGQKYLIKAFQKVLESYDNAKLTIIGYGRLEDELIDLVGQLNMKNKVTVIKNIDHKALPKVMQHHDLYIQPSIVTKDGAEENLSVATIEAQAAGLPCIVSNIGGLKEIVVNECTGFLVKEKSINDLTEKIVYFIKNQSCSKEYSMNARRNAITKFSKFVVIADLIRVYEMLVNSH